MHLNPLVTGLALAKTLVVAYVLCAIAQVVLPGAQFSHMWLQLFSAAPMGSLNMWAEGIIASIVAGFVLGYVFSWSYNWVSKKWK
jgi:hypothetical protein